VARDFANAKTACVRVDLGTQHSKNTTFECLFRKITVLNYW
jgi:hypothetical protein